MVESSHAFDQDNVTRPARFFVGGRLPPGEMANQHRKITYRGELDRMFRLS